MEERKKLQIQNEDGQILEYEILMTFKWSKTNKYYVIYTDNFNDDEMNIYASIYYPLDDTRLDDIETEEEWNEIEKKLNELQYEGEEYEG